jgi:hypothetical protein
MRAKTTVSIKEQADRRITELHIIEARKRALRLFCTGSSIFPDEWSGNTINETLNVDLTEFALHARCVSELCDLRKEKFPGADATRFKIEDPADFVFIDDYAEALNRLVHARKFVVGYGIWTGKKIWLNSKQEKIISYVKVETDRWPSANISVVGLATCFLGEVLITVKERFPDFLF